MENIFQNLKNNIDFFLRQHLNISRKNYVAENEPKDGLFDEKELIERENTLFEKFDLDYLKSNSTRQNYLENLYTIDLLDKYFNVDYQDDLSILDIGCKNWFYAKGEYFFFKKHCKNLILDGIELDTNRLYTNFYTRSEVARFNIKDLKNTNYIAGNFLEYDQKYDCIIWILPFVVENPLIKWGLPKKYFQPEKMLTHAFNSLNKNGEIFIINQGEVEYEAQKELCKKLNIQYTPLGKVESEFLQYEISRYSILIKNNPKE